MHPNKIHFRTIGLMVAVLALMTLSCTVSGLFGTPEPSGPPIDLAGIWRNPVTNTLVTIIWEDDEFQVIYIIDSDDGEVYELTSSDWNGTRIRWSYYVPSTTYNVTYTMTSLSGDILNTDFFNDHDMSGTRAWERE